MQEDYIDIFISYRWEDSVSIEDGNGGFSYNFRTVLKAYLHSIIGYRPKIWWDKHEIQGTHHIKAEVVDVLNRTFLFIPILTSAFRNSKWCKLELDTFIEACKRGPGLVVENKSRIIKVYQIPVPREEEPEVLQGIKGYAFFDQNPNFKNPRPNFFLMTGKGFDEELNGKFSDLAFEIKDVLGPTRRYFVGQNGALSSEDQVASKALKKGVFLAECAASMNPYRDKIKRSLKQCGYKVYPSSDLPSDRQKAFLTCQKYLASCCASIHIFGDQDKQIISATSHPLNTESWSLESLQVDAVAALPTSFSRYYWLSPLSVAAEGKWEEYLDQLRIDPYMQQGVNLFEGRLTDMLHSALETIEELPEPEYDQSEIASEAGSEKVFRSLSDHTECSSQDSSSDSASASLHDPELYLICTKADLPAVAPIKSLFEDQGIEVVLPAFNGQEGELMEAHFEDLISCDAVLVFYGIGSEIWLKNHLRDVRRKVWGYGREKSFISQSVCVSGPLTDHKQFFSSTTFEKLSMVDGFSSDPFLPLIQSILNNSNSA